MTTYIIQKENGECHKLEVFFFENYCRVIVDDDVSDMHELTRDELLQELEQPTF